MYGCRWDRSRWSSWPLFAAMPYTRNQDIPVFQDEVAQHVSAFSKLGGPFAKFCVRCAKTRMLKDLGGGFDDGRSATAGGGRITFGEELMQPVDVGQGIRMPD